MLHVFISVAKTLSIYPIYPTLFLFFKKMKIICFISLRTHTENFYFQQNIYFFFAWNLKYIYFSFFGLFWLLFLMLKNFCKFRDMLNYLLSRELYVFNIFIFCYYNYITSPFPYNTSYLSLLWSCSNSWLLFLKIYILIFIIYNSHIYILIYKCNLLSQYTVTFIYVYASGMIMSYCMMGVLFPG